MSIVVKSAKKKRKIDNPFSEPHNNSDVVIIVEGSKLYVHSMVLTSCSPVFKAMLSENFVEGKSKEIALPGKRIDVVIDMLKYFYPQYNQTVNELTYVEEQLALCQEYDLSWLTIRMENYLLECEYIEKEVVYWLALAVKYELKELKKELENFTFGDCFSCVKRYAGFKFIDKDTKVMLLKKRLDIVISDFCCTNCNSRNVHSHKSKNNCTCKAGNSNSEKIDILNFISEITSNK